VLKARIDQLESEVKDQRASTAEAGSDAAALTSAEKELVSVNHS
jgi:outer membrane murein-binding lipoprotein Lpp